MSQSVKAAYYRALQAVGMQFNKHYREHTIAELQEAYDKLKAQNYPGLPEVRTEPLPPVAEQSAPPAPPVMPQTPPQRPAAPPRQHPSAPVMPRDPQEMAGQRLNSKEIDEPIRTDEVGRVWFQEEVLKPAYPKPRGRRRMQYVDTGVKEMTVKNGDYVETFEVAGDPATAQTMDVKVTLPSFQVGIYKDPRFPFKVICYNGNEGFRREDVLEFYGGAELVPGECKRKYVENVLCYDIESVIRAISSEYRQQQLAGRHR